MDGHNNQWRSYLDLEPAEDELAHVFQSQRVERTGTLQHFAESLPGYQQQKCTSPTAMAPDPFLLSQSRSPGIFPSFWGSELSSFAAVAAKAAVAGQPSSSLFSFGGGQAGTFLLPEQDCVVDAVQVQQAPERQPWNAQGHAIAERRRREKMQQQFVALATIVPDLTKTDKLSVLGRTIEYVKQLEKKVKALEEQRSRKTLSASTHTYSDDSTEIATSAGGSNSNSNPTVEAIVHGDTVLLKIFCKDKRGVLVMVLSELEKRGLSILDANILSFTDSCLNITITAKVGDGFSNTDDHISSLTKAIREFTQKRNET